jgi:hypothetical protein
MDCKFIAGTITGAIIGAVGTGVCFIKMQETPSHKVHIDNSQIGKVLTFPPIDTNHHTHHKN